MLDTALPSQSDYTLLLSECTLGLADTAIEIKFLAHLCISKMVEKCAVLVVPFVLRIIEALTIDINTKAKPNAVKQEIEKSNELKRSCKRCSISLGKLNVGGILSNELEVFLSTVVQSCIIEE